MHKNGKFFESGTFYSSSEHQDLLDEDALINDVLENADDVESDLEDSFGQLFESDNMCELFYT